MWRHPKMVAWCLLTAVMILIARLPFFLVPIVPYHLDFNPGVALIPLSGVFFGPAGAWGAALATGTGDLLYGIGSVMTPFRVIGSFLFALASKKLWSLCLTRSDLVPEMIPTWRRTMRYMVVLAPGCFIDAAWNGFGSAVNGLYPFTYIAGIVLVHHLLFCAVLGPVLYRFFARELVPNFGHWRMIMHGEEQGFRLAFHNGAIIFIAAIGGWLAPFLVSGLVYGVWPFRHYYIGTIVAPQVYLAALPFLLAQIYTLAIARGEAGHHPQPPPATD